MKSVEERLSNDVGKSFISRRLWYWSDGKKVKGIPESIKIDKNKSKYFGSKGMVSNRREEILSWILTAKMLEQNT